LKRKLWCEPMFWRGAVCVVTTLLLLVELLPGSAVSAVRTDTGFDYITGSFLLPNSFVTAYYWLALLVTASSWLMSIIGLFVMTLEREWLVLVRAVLLTGLTFDRYFIHNFPGQPMGFLYCLIPVLVAVLLVVSVPASYVTHKTGRKAVPLPRQADISAVSADNSQV